LAPRARIAAQYRRTSSQPTSAATGRSATFAALTLAALAFLVAQLTLGASAYPGFDHGYSTPLALTAIAAFVLGSQVALVAGTLAAWRAAGSPPARGGACGCRESP